MRTGLILLPTLGLLLIGATCLPLADDSRSLPDGTVLGVSINAPATDRSVSIGAIVRIEWSITNRTDAEAAVTVTVQRRSDRAQTELTQETIAAQTTTTRALDWDTALFASGEYSVRIEVVAGDRRAEASGTGTVTIDSAPTFEFTAPTIDVTLSQDETVTITWTADDADGDATITISIDPDSDHASGNEIDILRDRTTSSLLEADSFEWDGVDADGNAVPGGTYNLFATVDDDVNPPVLADGLARITTPNAPPTLTFDMPALNITVDSGDTVDIAWTPFDADGDDLFVTILFDDDDSQDESAADDTAAEILVARQADNEDNRTFEWPTAEVKAGTYFLQALIEDGTNDEVFVVHSATVTISNVPTTLEFTSPTEDTDFLTSEAGLTFAFTVSDPDDDVLVDLKVDPDDNHSNGNEQTILLQRLVKMGDSDEEFEWSGTTWDGAALPNGIYTVFALVSDGTTPQTVELDALVFRRTNASDPLIALLEPDTPQTVDPGDFVTIRWRDDTPGDSATIEITLDDNPPKAGGPIGDPELQILADRDANTDGILDSFVWQVPGVLDPGTYYLIATIKNTLDVAAANEQVSVAQGTIIVRDPSNP